MLMPYYTKTAVATLKDLGVSQKGLPTSEAEERLKLHGKNIVRVKSEPLWRKLIEPFANVFVIVLFAAGVISILQRSYVDGAIILSIIVISAIIYYAQKFSTERILRALRKQNQHIVSVLRDGKTTKLDASLLVPGDIILLSEGEKIPADARIIDSDSLRIDESQLTGESKPISKQSDKLSAGKEVYEQSNMVFQGSFVVSGQASAVVTATGGNSQFGQLAALTSDLAIQSPVQKKIDKLISIIVGITAALAVVVFGLSLLRGMEIGQSLQFVIALSVSAVPEGLPVAISVILILGMRRMAAKKALVRTMHAIETVGVITTIATDKTGTLTKNKLTVGTVWQLRPSPQFPKLVAQTINAQGGAMLDPLDTALLDYAQEHNQRLSRYQPRESFPFDNRTSMSGNLWHHGDSFILAIKGAPETVLEHCSLSEGEREKIVAMLQQLSADGYRVIAIAEQQLKKEITSLKSSKKLRMEFAGLVGVADVLRPEAKHAIQTATKAGVTVRMITGDHFETAYHIGRQLGMVSNRNQVFDSRTMTVMSDEELERAIDDVRVFSRVTPERKYRLLALLKKKNITAMTGDGVNDVPALTGADVGIAMGSGAGIAKDAGDIILLDDNFKSIIDAMREGRAIIANVRRMLYYLLVTSTGEVLAMIGSLVIGIPVPLLPVQILWINLVTDTALVIPLGLEPGDKSDMTVRPKRPDAPILDKFMITRIVLVASGMALLVLGIYMYYSAAMGHEYARTIAFSSLVIMQWANAFSARSDRAPLLAKLGVVNVKFYIGFAIGVILQLLVLFGPLGSLLHITPVAIGDLVMSGVISFMAPLLLAEAHKFLSRKPTS